MRGDRRLASLRLNETRHLLQETSLAECEASLAASKARRVLRWDSLVKCEVSLISCELTLLTVRRA